MWITDGKISVNLDNIVLVEEVNRYVLRLLDNTGRWMEMKSNSERVGVSEQIMQGLIDGDKLIYIGKGQEYNNL